MSRTLIRLVLLIFGVTFAAAAQCPGDIGGQILGALTGIRPPDPCNVANQSYSFQPPRLDQLPQMIQQLPQTAAMWFLNPVGGQLAGAIDQARTRARNGGCDPAPADIVPVISQYMPPSVFNGVCWTVARPGLTLDSLAIGDGNIAAITLVDTIVFSDVNSAHAPDLWAHELIHVCQYRRLGLAAFASLYTVDWRTLENEAYSFQDYVQAHINAQNQGPFYQGSSNWDPNSPIASDEYVQAAKGAIDPRTCVHLERGQYSNEVDVFNQCPIVMRVTAYVGQIIQTGQTVTAPCTGTCDITPGAPIKTFEPPGLYIVSVFAANW